MVLVAKVEDLAPKGVEEDVNADDRAVAITESRKTSVDVYHTIVVGYESFNSFLRMIFTMGKSGEFDFFGERSYSLTVSAFPWNYNG